MDDKEVRQVTNQLMDAIEEWAAKQPRKTWKTTFDWREDMPPYPETSTPEQRIEFEHQVYEQGLEEELNKIKCDEDFMSYFLQHIFDMNSDGFNIQVYDAINEYVSFSWVTIKKHELLEDFFSKATPFVFGRDIIIEYLYGSQVKFPRALKKLIDNWFKLWSLYDEYEEEQIKEEVTSSFLAQVFGRPDLFRPLSQEGDDVTSIVEQARSLKQARSIRPKLESNCAFMKLCDLLEKNGITTSGKVDRERISLTSAGYLIRQTKERLHIPGRSGFALLGEYWGLDTSAQNSARKGSETSIGDKHIADLINKLIDVAEKELPKIITE